jgi:hypothetical protein
MGPTGAKIGMRHVACRMGLVTCNVIGMHVMCRMGLVRVP